MKKLLLVALALSALTIVGCSSSNESSTTSGSSTTPTDEGIGLPATTTSQYDGVWRITDLTGYGEQSDFSGTGYFVVNGNRYADIIDGFGIDCNDIAPFFQTLTLVDGDITASLPDGRDIEETYSVETVRVDNTLMLRYFNVDGSVRYELTAEFVSEYESGDLAALTADVACADNVSGIWEFVGIKNFGETYTETSGIRGRIFMYIGRSVAYFEVPGESNCVIIQSEWDLETFVKSTDQDSNKHNFVIEGGVDTGSLKLIDNDLGTTNLRDYITYSYVGPLFDSAERTYRTETNDLNCTM